MGANFLYFIRRFSDKTESTNIYRLYYIALKNKVHKHCSTNNLCKLRLKKKKKESCL